MTTEDTNTGKAPTHIAYQVREGNKQSYWTRTGAAWVHKDGKGFSIQLDSLPHNGGITLRMTSESQ